MLLDPVELSLRETMRCCEAELEAGPQCACEGGHAGSLSHTPSLARFWQHCGRRVDARAFEGHLLHVSLREPAVKLHEPTGGCRKGSNRFLDAPIRLAEQPTSYDGFLMHIQTTTAFIYDLHSLSPFRNSFCL